MMKNMDKTTLILEQYRADMDALAALGEPGMNEAVAKAEKRAKICAQEWRQATKAVELTGNQEKAVADARQAGEEKLNAAKTEEDDARIAAETVRRMIDDAATVRCVANKDTAKILERAENVLDETGNRAAVFFNDKKQQREEIEAAMLRLYATEKAVLYTMAKAQRNEGEKLLAKIIADKKYEVCAAECEVMKQTLNKEDLENREKQQQELLKQLNSDLERAEQYARSCRESEADATEDFTRRIEQCRQDTEQAVKALSEEEAGYQDKKAGAEAELTAAGQEAADKEKASDAALQQAEDIRLDAEDTLKKTKQAHDESISQIEESLSQRRQAAARCNAAYIDAVARLDDAVAEADRLRGIVSEYSAKAAEAEAEEKSAREATETANRLAENAIKIRESISSESSQLLLHAQEVLIEAASSAQQLMDEKSILRQSAEKECQRVGEQASAVEEAAHTAEEEASRCKIAWQEAEDILKADQEEAEQRRAELAGELESLTLELQEKQEAAFAEADRLRDIADTAVEKMNAAQSRLDEINDNLQRLAAEKQQQISDGEDRSQKLSKLRDDTLQELADDYNKAEKNVINLQERCVTTRDILTELGNQIQNCADQLRVSTNRVNEIILSGVAAIQAAEEDVQRRFAAEDAARRAAEDAVAHMSASSGAPAARLNQDSRSLSSAENIAELTDIIEGSVENEPLAPLGFSAAPLKAPAPEPVYTPAPEPPAYTPAPANIDAAIAAIGFDNVEPVDEPLFAEQETPDVPPPAESYDGFPIMNMNAEPEPEPEAEADMIQDEPVFEHEPVFEPEPEIEPEPVIEPESVFEPEPMPEPMPEPIAEAEAATELFPEAEEAAFDQQPTEEEPAQSAPVDLFEMLSDLDEPEEDPEALAATEEERLEYTQRLEIISNDLLENTIIPPDAEVEPPAPAAEGGPQDWLDNLARSIGEEEQEQGQQEAEPEAAPQAPEEAPPQPTTELDLAPLLGGNIDGESNEEEDMPTISEAVVKQTPENNGKGVDEDELRLSILSTVDEGKEPKSKKRRFPFF